MTGRSDSTHECPVASCTRRVARHHLACARHWALVDRHTQQRVYAAYRSDDVVDHAEAMSDAIDEMNRAVTQ